MRCLKVLGLFAASIAVWACEKEKVQPVPLPPELLSVQVTSQEIEIPKGGSADIFFTVEEKDFSFGLAHDVTLFPSSDDYTLKEIRPQGEGSYVAVVEDNGLDASYEHSVRLGVREEAGTNIFLFSSTFTLRRKRPDPEDLIVKTGLPIVYVQTENEVPIVSKTDYVSAGLSIRSADGNLDVKGLTCSVRGRGNTTWWWPKKPYLIKLDKKEQLLGMPKHKRWILLANFMDRTLMRNLVSMKVSSLTGLEWTPRCQPVELVLNGKHMGSYLLIEQVRVDKSRVNITEMTAEDNSGEAVTGGYLLESDFHYDNEVQWTDEHGKCVQMASGIPFGVKYPDPEDITASQLEYIKKYISDTAEAIYGPNFADPEEGYAKYIDVDSFVNYWIVFEVMGNHELSNPGSVYFHKDRGGKLKAGPCWDFDWGVLSYNTSPQAKTGLLNHKAIWYARLFEDPAFKEKVKTRFMELLPLLETIPDYMDEMQEKLYDSAGCNFRMWDPAQDASQNGGNIINGDENLSFPNAVARLRSIYQERLQVIAASL